MFSNLLEFANFENSQPYQAKGLTSEVHQKLSFYKYAIVLLVIL